VFVVRVTEEECRTNLSQSQDVFTVSVASSFVPGNALLTHM
jgi:hypothetical protein